MKWHSAVGVATLVMSMTGVGIAAESPAVTGAVDPSVAGGVEWPREIDTPDGKIILYQPQPETFKGDRLTARAAVSVTPKDATEQVFGAVWFDARVSTDRDARTVTILSMEIPRVKFPDASADQEGKLADTLKSRLPSADLTFSLDHLLAGIALAEKEEIAVDSIATAPPKIIFSKTPAVLVALDGKPELRPVEKTKLMRVVNTPFTILLDPDTKAYYLNGGDRWYTATDIMGSWVESVNTPAAVSAAVPSDPGADTAGEAASTPASSVPRIIVATEPTELIVSNGDPTWTPIEGNQLLYMGDSENDVFMEIGSQQYYVLLAGRWYRAASMNGPWAYVASDKLPPSFAKIPYDSPKGSVLVHVAGTEQAREAVLDASIPQTTTVKPGPADLKVAYDGEPNFKKIEGTEMTYAANTTDSVIQVKKKYYCCRNAVWYVAKSPTGPWEVCTKVPKEVYTIPPNCPVYNVRYVNVYNATPEAVSVGYLPGYTGNYVLNNTVVYGTGFSYPPWPGPVYIPTPMTWGFCPVYNSWSGAWGYGAGPWAGNSRGWVNWGGGHGGWWGPGGYHPVNWSAHNGQLNVNGKTYNANNFRNNNLYHQGDHPAHAAQAGKGQLQAPKAGGNIANNVFADKNGNVFRKTQDGWEHRGGDGWTKNFAAPSEGAARGIGQRFNEPARQDITRSRGQGGGRPAGSDFGGRDFSGMDRGFDRSDLESHSYARQRGMDRANDFNRNFSSSDRGGFDRGGFDRGSGGRGGFHGGGGGFHGGGGRR